MQNLSVEEELLEDNPIYLYSRECKRLLDAGVKCEFYLEANEGGVLETALIEGRSVWQTVVIRESCQLIGCPGNLGPRIAERDRCL